MKYIVKGYGGANQWKLPRKEDELVVNFTVNARDVEEANRKAMINLLKKGCDIFTSAILWSDAYNREKDEESIKWFEAMELDEIYTDGSFIVYVRSAKDEKKNPLLP